MPVVNSAEFATLDGLPLQTPAWTHHNLWELWSGPTMRGGDVIIPGTRGVRAGRREVAASKLTLELSIVGFVDSDGAEATDFRAQLWANVAELRSACDTTDGPVLLTLHAPNGDELSSYVHVERFALGGDLGEFATKATIDVTLLNGEFTASPGSV